MNNNYVLDDSTVHLWRLRLPNFTHEAQELLNLLSEDEVKRAKQFEFPIHQDRFIITRGLLRKTLGLYLETNPKSIVFAYGELGKPVIPSSEISFNISHSHELAIFAFAQHKNIGVDIQIMEDEFKQAVAKRMFTIEEYEELMQEDVNNQIPAFYQLWSRKEALIKALGKGLFTPTRHISLSFLADTQSIMLENFDEYVIQDIKTEPGYKAAFAALAPIDKVIEFECTPERIIDPDPKR